jgi:hypothetical protein
MDSMPNAISDDIWYATEFLTVEEIWLCEVGGPSRIFYKPLEGHQEA